MWKRWKKDGWQHRRRNDRFAGSEARLVVRPACFLVIATGEGAGQVETVGLVFQTLDYGVALPHGSPHREPINLALLHLIEQGEYQRLYEEWFGESALQTSGG